MIVLYVFLALLALLLLLLLIPVGAGARYGDELQVWARYGLIKIRLYPRRARQKPQRPQKEKKKHKKDKQEEPEQQSKFSQIAAGLKRDSLGETLELAGQLMRWLGKTARAVLRAITVDRVFLDLLIVAGEADKTAVRYGQACAVLYPAMTTLRQTMRVRRHRLTVTPGFGRDKGAVAADVRVHVIPLRVLIVALGALLGFVRITAQDKTETPADQRQA